MPYYDIPSYAEYEGCDEDPEQLTGAYTTIACLLEDKPVVKENTETTVVSEDDIPF